MAFKNYYMILGIKNSASLDEIKIAFRKLAKKYHPDTNNENKNAEDFFKELQEAYETLSNPEKRRKYDQKYIYAHHYQQVKGKTTARYTGNAYQYAQQQTQHNHSHQAPQNESEFVKTNRKEEKKDSDSYFFVISIVIAILLLLFIITYSNEN